MIEITRDEIDNKKRQAKEGGNAAYALMVNILSAPYAMDRACIVPGTYALQWALNGCILFGKLIIPAIIVLLLMRLWVLAAVAAVVGYIVVFRIQTEVNYEIGARLFALDQHLDIDTE